MKRLITLFLTLTLLMGGIAAAEEMKTDSVREWDSPFTHQEKSGVRLPAELNSYDVWIGSAFAATLGDSSFIAVSVFSPGETIQLPVAFFVPSSGNWETNWIVTDGVGTIVFAYYTTVYISGQTIKAQVVSTSLPRGDYTFTAAVLGRDVGQGAISHQYRFAVR